MQTKLQDQYIVFSGRFQPFHHGHLRTIKFIAREYRPKGIITCVLRNRSTNPRIDRAEPESQFSSEVELAATGGRNPLPNWHRFELVRRSILADTALREFASVQMRDWPDLEWYRSLENLPSNRVFAFNGGRDESFSKLKAEHYQNQGEQVLYFSHEVNSETSGTEIREMIERGRPFDHLLPEGARQFFIEECLDYFRK